MKAIQKIIDEFNIEKNIIVVANAMKYTEKMSFYTINHAIDDEFFSHTELADIVFNLFKTKNYINVFYSEIDFIDYIIRNHENVLHQDIKDDILIYNLARDGVKEGKKSLIPSFCDLFNLNYIGSNAFVVSLCRNKFAWTSIALSNSITVPKSILYKYQDKQIIGEIGTLLNKKVIIKCNNESASIGLDYKNILKLSSENDVIEISNQIRGDTIIQEFISGIECEVPIFKLDNKYIALDPIEIIKKEEILTSKISSNYDYEFDFLNKHLDSNICEEIKKTAEKFASILNIEVYGRVDFRIDNDNFYIIDVATSPYTISHSSFAFAFKENGYREEDLYKVILYATTKKNLYVVNR